MAKGVEDTATYRYPGLAVRADVGSDPDSIVPPDTFHEFRAKAYERVERDVYP